jgi:hypothetical protein
MCLNQALYHVRRTSTPITGVVSCDTPATEQDIVAQFNEQDNLFFGPILRFSVCDGLTAANVAAESIVAGYGPLAAQTEPAVMLTRIAPSLPGGSILIWRGCAPLLANAKISQGIVDLREQYKKAARNGQSRLLILLDSHFALPVSLQNDVMLIRVPLPTPTAYGDILQHETANARAGMESAGLDSSALDLPGDVCERAINACAGMSAFQASQAIAMSLRKSGLNLDALRQSQRESVNSTPGLKFLDSKRHANEIKGNDQLIRFLVRHAQHSGGIVLLNELEKAFAGLGTFGHGDSSGVTQDQLRTVLELFDVCGKKGILINGVPGTGKTVSMECVSSELQIPGIVADLGQMQGGIVGQSQMQTAAAKDKILSVTAGRPCIIATSNSRSILPVELLSRLQFQFFVDFPSTETAESIWHQYMHRYEIAEQPIPASENWTGREIECCCQTAFEHSITLLESAEYIVPIAISDNLRVQQMRLDASGKLLRADRPGVYRVESGTAGRAAIGLPD